MNSSWSVSDRQWQDSTSPISLPRDINALGYGAGTPESPVSLNNDDEEEDIISVLSHPPSLRPVLSHPPSLRPNTMDDTVAEEEDKEEEEVSSVVSAPTNMHGGVERTEGEGEEAAEEIISVHSIASDIWMLHGMIASSAESGEVV